VVGLVQRPARTRVEDPEECEPNAIAQFRTRERVDQTLSRAIAVKRPRVDQRRGVLLWRGLPTRQQRRLEAVRQDMKAVGDFRMKLEEDRAAPIGHRHDRARLCQYASLKAAKERAATIQEWVSGPQVPELDDERSTYDG